MLRAVPETVRTAESRFVVMRSTSLIFAISSTCFLVTLPTLLRFGSGEPLAIPQRAIAALTLANLEDERECAVGINRDQHRKNHSIRFFLRLGIELLAEIHDVHAMGTERGSHRRAGVALPADNCSLMVVCIFFGGIFLYLYSAPAKLRRALISYPSFSTLAKSSSTGVERPKIVTDTFNRLWSLSISSTVPLKFANGPSTMRTCSLRS